jgi:hypothetical protein
MITTTHPPHRHHIPRLSLNLRLENSLLGEVDHFDACLPLGGSFAKRIVPQVGRLSARRLARIARRFGSARDRLLVRTGGPSCLPDGSSMSLGGSVRRANRSCRSLNRLGVGSLDGSFSGAIR